MTNLFLSTLSKAINRFLALDPASAERLHQLDNKIITIELLPLKFIFQLTITEQAIKLTPHETLTADAHIKGTPIQLMGVMLNKANRTQFFASDVSVTGNVEVGQQIIRLFDELNIDWEEQLSRLIGDSAAHQIGKAANRVTNWLNKINDSLTSQTSEYLQEEAQLLAGKAALHDFFTEIDTLRMDVDRIEAKINLLAEKFATPIQKD